MLIPIRCFECGKLLANKWEYYQRRLKEEKGETFGKPKYFDGKNSLETPEKKIYEELHLTRYCCRKTLLTTVDLLSKF
jgi:DNA-directed RNA polymerase subunit N (RpoN/RPB10)